MQWLWYREWCRFPSAACGARPRARPGNRPTLLPPHGFELCLGDLKRRDHGVVADIVGDKVESSVLADFVQQGDHVCFARYVGDDRFGAAACVPDFAGDGRNARLGASSGDDPQALLGKPARERGTEPGRRSYAHHNGRLYAHDNAKLMTVNPGNCRHTLGGPQCGVAREKRQAGTKAMSTSTKREGPPLSGAALPLSNRGRFGPLQASLADAALVKGKHPGHVSRRPRRKTMRHWITSFRLLL